MFVGVSGRKRSAAYVATRAGWLLDSTEEGGPGQPSLGAQGHAKGDGAALPRSGMGSVRALRRLSHHRTRPLPDADGWTRLLGRSFGPPPMGDTTAAEGRTTAYAGAVRASHDGSHGKRTGGCASRRNPSLRPPHWRECGACILSHASQCASDPNTCWGRDQHVLGSPCPRRYRGPRWAWTAVVGWRKREDGHGTSHCPAVVCRRWQAHWTTVWRPGRGRVVGANGVRP